MFAHRNTIDKILPSSIDGIANLQLVFAAFGNLVKKNRVRIETVIVREGYFVAPGIVEGQRGLKPAGHGIGQIRDQAPSLRFDYELLSLARTETETIDVPRHNLSIQQYRQIVGLFLR